MLSLKWYANGERSDDHNEHRPRLADETVQARIKSMVDAGRSLEEIESWLARQSLTDLEQDVCFILARHKLSRHSEAVEGYLVSIEAGIGA
jgi:hypothetical protein